MLKTKQKKIHDKNHKKKQTTRKQENVRKKRDANVEFFKWIFKNHNQTDPTYLKQYDPTFEEFLTFIVQKVPDHSNEDPHWRSFT